MVTLEGSACYRRTNFKQHNCHSVYCFSLIPKQDAIKYFRDCALLQQMHNFCEFSKMYYFIIIRTRNTVFVIVRGLHMVREHMRLPNFRAGAAKIKQTTL